MKNLQGDVIAITNSKGNVVARYTYDAWGECTIVSDTTGIIARINPYRYRSYYFDQETSLYYVFSRYYDAVHIRWINADEPGMLVLNIGITASNIYNYSYNSPIVFSDYSGCAASISIPAFVGMYGFGLSGAALIAKLTAYATMMFPYLIWGIAIIVAVAVTAYVAYQAYLKSTKMLSNVRAKTTSSKVFKLAYAKGNSLIKVGKSLSFVEALTVLGVKKAACSLTRRYSVTAKRPSTCKTSDWGMYSTNQAYACALATMLGCSSKPEVHGSATMGIIMIKNILSTYGMDIQSFTDKELIVNA